MAADYAKMAEELCRFYDFKQKQVLFVGAGTKQLLTPAAGTRKIIAIDRDADSLRELKDSIAQRGLQEAMDVIGAPFEEVTTAGDVVYFEFCLHEMDDPEQALAHAKSLAPDVVVYDHSPGSEWIYYGAEEEKVARSSATMLRLGIRRRETFVTEQRFAKFDELLAKVAPQGEVAVQRIQKFAECGEIVIPMKYEVNLL